MLTAEKLRELFLYDPAKGLFTRRTYRSPNAKIGDVAGTPDADGYIQIQIDGKLYKAHRLAWLYMTGEWPSSGIDHRDTVKSNNAWSNLRPASQAQNAANCGMRSFNTSGFKGVTFDKKKGRWMAQIQVRGKCVHLGYHATPENAHAAYVEAAGKIHGEFARAS
ncbi:HNH endonuclease [Ochrobactrum intermedium]|uniref:HNH endonuclease n=1 Tax=Brucella intermedia TaxID=94625 RepID=UPI00159C7982|nr:HNH endonuclease [Brucella intermedia]NVM41916.1 HNH endonuclease [Brucella intermedia]